MYLAERNPVLVDAERPDFRRRRPVARNVVFLGLTSLFTDISSEMVGAVLPLYLTFQFRWSPLQFGLFDGLYQATAAVLRTVGAAVADRTRRYKETAAAGYSLSAACKLALLATAGSWVLSTGVLFADRLGKGIRTAPRDALISLSSWRGDLGLAFGVHRALDTVGVMVGPFVAFLLLSSAPGAYDAVFVTSFCSALIGLAVLGLFVGNRPVPVPDRATRTPVSLRSMLGLLERGPFRSIVVAGSVLALVTVGDNLLYLTLQRRASLRVGFFPLLFVGTAAVYMVLAAPLGRLADRVGRVEVFLAGHLLLLGVYATLSGPWSGAVVVAVGIVLFGAYYAATDGVLMALASSVLPTELRSSGLALLTTATLGCRAVASVLFGALWTWRGPSPALTCFLVVLGGALFASARLLWRQPELAT